MLRRGRGVVVAGRPPADGWRRPTEREPRARHGEDLARVDAGLRRDVDADAPTLVEVERHPVVVDLPAPGPREIRANGPAHRSRERLAIPVGLAHLTGVDVAGLVAEDRLRRQPACDTRER